MKADTDAGLRSIVRGLLSTLLFCLAILGTPTACFGSFMSPGQSDKSVYDFTSLVCIASLFAAIGLARKSTWARAAGGVVAGGVVLLGVVAALAERNRNTTSGLALIAIFFLIIGTLLYLGIHYATGREPFGVSSSASQQDHTSESGLTV